jgi:hypothetical protein
MWIQLWLGAFVSITTFGIHAVITGVIVVLTRHVAGATDELHVFMRVIALMLITVVTLMAAHVTEIAVWALAISLAGVTVQNAGPFEFAFENYVALGYGDVVAGGDARLIGPIMALNGLLLIGWSVAIIFEVMKMAEVQIGRKGEPQAD